MSTLDIDAIKTMLAFEMRPQESASVGRCREFQEPFQRAHWVAACTALLAEVERLQRERSEWCDRADVLMTEHMTQLRDLLAEVAALRERLTLTEDVLVKAQAAFMKASAFCDWQEGVRAALLAAGMEEAR